MLVKRASFCSLEQAAIMIGRCIGEYNNQSHSTLGGMTPIPSG
jgi:hypothetical protein